VDRRLQDSQQPLQLTGRDGLLRLLATKTVSRAIDLIRRHRPEEVHGGQDITQLLTRDPTPEEADECQRLLDLLKEPDLRRTTLWKVEGYTNEEIAARLECVPRTVERKVRRICLLRYHELKDLEP
jgi:DNA-directed RNA polymerase specialized sigma24 family protein